LAPEMEDEPLRNEAYRLASGFALGLINLGKGVDLKGLHDMKVEERLLRQAVGSKRVEVVHIMDKSTAAAIVAIAFINMKSGNASLAKKIDIPDSILQYDYVRPDMFLLRTLAKHLIMWDEIDASAAWIKRMLPEHFRPMADLKGVDELISEDLPFYNIVAGLLFAMALRHAGSGSPQVRDLLLDYLDQMSRVCSLAAVDFDQKLTRTTVRNCLDLTALSVSVVMAGTGDLATLRRLRALHGRDDADTTYGSHLAAHIAIGALFLGGGTHTFGTTNLAIATLIIAFYPLFPTTILDNKSHLQAFRHFWVLATEPRCLITRDLDTNRPVSVPLNITLRSGKTIAAHTPLLLPELKSLGTVATSSREFWNVVLDFGAEGVEAMFRRSQDIWVRRKQANDANVAVFQATLQALDASPMADSAASLAWLFGLASFSDLTKAERALVLGEGEGAVAADSDALSMHATVVDARLVLEQASLASGRRDRLMALRLLFRWHEALEAREATEGVQGRMRWLRGSVLESLKARVWMASEM
jgi:anaphase-promoting complex subunit 1